MQRLFVAFGRLRAVHDMRFAMHDLRVAVFELLDLCNVNREPGLVPAAGRLCHVRDGSRIAGASDDGAKQFDADSTAIDARGE
jgi:hypothetical protein